MIDLTGHLDRLVARVERQEFPRAAEAMAEAVRREARAALGGDLTLSHGGGTVEIDGRPRRGESAVVVGGAYKLVDEGRHTVRDAVAPPGSALNTPWGPRRSVRGSTSRGKQITARSARDAFAAGRAGVMAEVDWGRR